MPAYDDKLFIPPAPLAQVTLRNPERGTVLGDVAMLLDSGANVTLIPQRCLEPLGAVPVPNKYYELAGFEGSKSLAPIVRLELTFLKRTFRGQFLLIDQNWGIMGRNILNRLPLLFDGPNLIWKEHHR